MLVHILKSKIHRAKVTGGNVQYEGSLTIDEDFMDKVGLVPFEKILCSNMANAARFETYAIPRDARLKRNRLERRGGTSWHTGGPPHDHELHGIGFEGS